jgi:hypothetical protein
VLWDVWLLPTKQHHKINRTPLSKFDSLANTRAHDVVSSVSSVMCHDAAPLTTFLQAFTSDSLRRNGASVKSGNGRTWIISVVIGVFGRHASWTKKTHRLLYYMCLPLFASLLSILWHKGTRTLNSLLYHQHPCESRSLFCCCCCWELQQSTRAHTLHHILVLYIFYTFFDRVECVPPGVVVKCPGSSSPRLWLLGSNFY